MTLILRAANGGIPPAGQNTLKSANPHVVIGSEIDGVKAQDSVLAERLAPGISDR
jgi:hypothetical protein